MGVGSREQLTNLVRVERVGVNEHVLKVNAGGDGFAHQVSAVEQQRLAGAAFRSLTIPCHDRVLPARNPLHGRSIALWYLLN